MIKTVLNVCDAVYLRFTLRLRLPPLITFVYRQLVCPLLHKTS